MSAARRVELFTRITAELDHAYAKHGRQQWGRHEFFGILKEEVDELWREIMTDGLQDRLEEELVQVAAMCFRYYETGDRRFRPACEGCGAPDAADVQYGTGPRVSLCAKCIDTVTDTAPLRSDVYRNIAWLVAQHRFGVEFAA